MHPFFFKVMPPSLCVDVPKVHVCVCVCTVHVHISEPKEVCV